MFCVRFYISITTEFIRIGQLTYDQLLTYLYNHFLNVYLLKSHLLFNCLTSFSIKPLLLLLFKEKLIYFYFLQSHLGDLRLQ